MNMYCHIRLSSLSICWFIYDRSATVHASLNAIYFCMIFFACIHNIIDRGKWKNSKALSCDDNNWFIHCRLTFPCLPYMCKPKLGYVVVGPWGQRDGWACGFGGWGQPSPGPLTLRATFLSLRRGPNAQLLQCGLVQAISLSLSLSHRPSRQSSNQQLQPFFSLRAVTPVASIDLPRTTTVHSCLVNLQ